MKFVPTVVHHLPHLGYRFERKSLQLFAEASAIDARSAGWMAEQWTENQDRRILDRITWYEPLDITSL